MPYYEYICKECSHKFDEIHKVDDREKPTKLPCPSCGKKECVEISIGAVINIWKTEKSTL
jgi:putative FmdB family regulatory protein